MFLISDKEIFELKLVITTNCILRCSYCFVNKPEGDSKMDLGTAKRTIDFFLSSQGREKILKIYGGEPLLNFGVVEELIPYVKRTARDRNINLTLSLCTNAVLLKPEHINFFKKNKFQIAISLDGTRATHDEFRRFPDGDGTFNKVKKNLRCLLEIIDKEDLACNMGVAPSEAKKLFKNFKYVLKTGFDTLNIEPIYGFQKWTFDKQRIFEEEMKSIIGFIINEIPKGNFFFLTTINRELRYQTLSKVKNKTCLFYNLTEICPDGRIGFSSFFLNLPKDRQKKYIIGNVINGEINDKFRNCVYSRDSKNCQICFKDYFDIPNESMSSKVVQKRNDLSIFVARLIQERAKNNPIFKRYIQKAKNHICF